MTFRTRVRIKALTPPKETWLQRQWIRCKKHGNVAHYLYQPFSLSNPIKERMKCGCSAHFNDREITIITEVEAIQVLNEELVNDVY